MRWLAKPSIEMQTKQTDICVSHDTFIEICFCDVFDHVHHRYPLHGPIAAATVKIAAGHQANKIQGQNRTTLACSCIQNGCVISFVAHNTLAEKVRCINRQHARNKFGTRLFLELAYVSVM